MMLCLWHEPEDFLYQPPGRNRLQIRVEFRRARRWRQRTKGWYDPRRHLIVVYTHWAWTWTSVQITLLHELAHASGRPGCCGHGRLFRALLVRMARDVWDLDLGPPRTVARECRSVREVEGRVWWRCLKRQMWPPVHRSANGGGFSARRIDHVRQYPSKYRCSGEVAQRELRSD